MYGRTIGNTWEPCLRLTIENLPGYMPEPVMNNYIKVACVIYSSV